MEVKGIFVTRFSKADVKLCFDEIAKKYGTRTALIGGNSMQKSSMNLVHPTNAYFFNS